jgi:hypothetical protein
LLDESGAKAVDLVEVPPAKQCGYCKKAKGCWGVKEKEVPGRWRRGVDRRV